MNREAKATGVIGAVLLISVALGVSAGYFSFSGLPILAALTGIVLLMGFITQNKKVTDIMENLNKRNSNEKTFTEQEIRESVKEWTIDNYSNFDSAGFKWSKAETDTFNLPDFGKSDRLWKTIRYYYTPLGPSGKGAFIYWDQDNDEFHSHKRVTKDSRKDPAWHCTEFREWVKSGRPRPRPDTEDENEQPQFVLNGIPPGDKRFQGNGGANAE